MRLCERTVFDAQSFSAVVGPNGSGKSNVIDAMLFVFGKRAKQVSCLFSHFGCVIKIKFDYIVVLLLFLFLLSYPLYLLICANRN